MAIWTIGRDLHPRIHPLRRLALEQRLAERVFAALEDFFGGKMDDDAMAEAGLEALWEVYVDLKALKLPPCNVSIRRGVSVFDDATVRMIRSMLRSQTQTAVARRLGVDQTMISAIARGASYARVED